MPAKNETIMHLRDKQTAHSGGLFQYDYGQKLIFTGVDLPSAYEVHFSNKEQGKAKTVIGDQTGVSIPDEYLVSGDPVYVWVFLHEANEDGETEYHGVIDVNKRAEPTNDEPTPEQQDEITQVIAALNAAVDEAEDAKRAIEDLGVSAESLGKGSDATVTKTVDPQTGAVTLSFGLPRGDDGYSPTASVAKSGHTSTITITDKNGTTTAEVTDGVDTDPTTLIDDTAGEGTTNKTWSADKLSDLSDKVDGAAEILEINVAKDKNDPDKVICDTSGQDIIAAFDAGKIIIANVERPMGQIPTVCSGIFNRVKGSFGALTVYMGEMVFDTGETKMVLAGEFISDEVIPGGHEQWILRELNEIYQTDTIEGSPFSAQNLRITSLADPTLSTDATTKSYVDTAVNAKYTKPADGIPASDLASGVIPSVPVQDVQVNGTSVLSQGVANVPVAGENAYGVLKVGSAVSTGLVFDQSGYLKTSYADSSLCKAGANYYKPIVPAAQHTSTFYGLAKAAGDSTQSASSNAVGTYTESAKSAISDMLNAPETVSGSTPSITAKPGVRYICGECSTLTIVVPASGIIDVTFESGSTPTVLTITPPTGKTLKWIGDDPSALEANKTYEINIMDGEFGMVISWT